MAHLKNNLYFIFMYIQLSNFSVPTILVQKEGKLAVRLEKPQEGQKPNQKVQETKQGRTQKMENRMCE